MRNDSVHGVRYNRRPVGARHWLARPVGVTIVWNFQIEFANNKASCRGGAPARPSCDV